jgi:cyclopropane-fatty-acyl-phospholipid synthase
MRPEHSHTFPEATFSSTVAPFASTPLDRWALRAIQRVVPRAPIRFVLWDGYALGGDGAAPLATIFIKNRRALFSWLWDPALNFGEAYMFGAVEIRGELVPLLEEIYRALPRDERRRRLWRHDNDIAAARENVHRHYDLGNEFYQLWLDRLMVYTCAYYPAADTTLEAAQIAKLDRVCRKRQLSPGERVVEAGCGWGALALHMARVHGVTVRAFNVSSEQIAYAREQARAGGLADRVEFIEDDYRAIDGECDVFVSVGMLEHVGVSDYESLGRAMARTLAGNGRGLLHFIGRNQPMPLNAWIRKRIFPGAYPPTLAEVFTLLLEPRDFSVLDVENLRPHYSRTLAAWRERFEAHADRIAQKFDDAFVRAWRLYLAGSEAAFNTGALQLFQVVFARGASREPAWSRIGAS